MPDIAALSVRIDANTAALESGLARASQQVSGFGSVLAGIGAGVGMKVFDTVVSGFEAAGKASIGFNSNLEQSTIAFTSMLGSAEKAQAFLDDMKQFAATTPFEFPDLLQASKQMMAFGFAAKDVRPLLTAVGSAASAMGTGKSGVDAITKALGQMRAATVVQAGELNQLTEQGVPAFQILADAMGISTGEVKKLASEGKIASDVFIDAFQVWAQQNYGDMMAKQALTFEGAVSTIKDSLQFAVAEAFKPFFEVISAGAVELSKFVQSDRFTTWAKTVADTARDAFRQVADGVRTVQQVLAGDWAPSDQIETFTLAVGNAAVMIRDTFGAAITTAGAILQQLAGWFQQNAAPIAAFVAGFAGAIVTAGLLAAAITGVVTVLGFLLSPLGLVAVAVGALAVAWQTNFLGIQEATAALWAYLQPVLTELVAWLGEKIPPVLTWISDTGWPALVSAGQTVATFVTGTLIPGITQLVDWLGPKLQPVVTWLSDTGWPALVAAAQKVYDVGLLVIQFVQQLWAELEKRGIVEGATKAFTDLHAILEPVYNVLILIVGIAAKVLGFLADLAVKGLESGAGVKFLADQMYRFFEPIADGLGTLAKLIEMLRSLGNIQVPSWWGSNPFGGGGSVGSTFSTMSWRGAGAADPNASQADVEAFAYQAAKARGWSDKDARELVSLISGEGAGQGARALGDSGRSFGPLQLFTGGGLGNEAERAGINLRDPSTWQQQILFGMDTIEREGAGQWTVARNRGLLRTPPARISVPDANMPASALGPIITTQAQWGAGVGMTPQEAAAACGPYAAYLFAQATGRTPNPREAEQLARAAGWTEAGMGGTANFMRLLGSMGVRAVQTATGGMSADDITRMAANAGPMAAFSTPGHYFASTGFDPSTGKFNVGATGTFAGGSEWMSVSEMAALMGPIQDIVTLAGQMGPAFQVAGAATGQAFQQMGAIVTEQGAVMVSASTDTMGNVTRIYSDATGVIGATITDASGQIVNSWGTMATGVTAQSAAMSTGVTEQTNLMASGALTSVTNLGTGILTTVTDSAGTTIATVTDMSGQVTSQYATLANGAVLEMGNMAAGVLTSTTDLGTGVMTTVQDMSGNYITTITDLSGNVTAQYTSLAEAVTTTTAEQGQAVAEETRAMGEAVLTSVTDMGDGVITITQDASGQMIATITDMAGNVTSQYATMGSDVAGSAEEMSQTVTETVSSMASDTVEAFGEIPPAAEDAKQAMDAVGKVKIPAPDVSKVISAMHKIESAADDAYDAVSNVSGKGGHKGGDPDKKGDPFAKRAMGGPVDIGRTYLVGEQGPELFSPYANGTIIPNHALGMGGGGRQEIVFVIRQPDGRTLEEWVVTGTRLAAERGRV